MSACLGLARLLLLANLLGFPLLGLPYDHALDPPVGLFREFGVRKLE